MMLAASEADGVDGRSVPAKIGVAARGATIFSGGGLSGSVVIASSTFLRNNREDL
jgi:predicted flavoprotein YhiN